MLCAIADVSEWSLAQSQRLKTWRPSLSPSARLFERSLHKKLKFSIMGFCSKCDLIGSFLWIYILYRTEFTRIANMKFTRIVNSLPEVENTS